MIASDLSCRLKGSIRMKEVSLASSDGCKQTLSLYLQNSESDPIKKDVTIVCFPAMGVASKFYKPLLEALFNAGFDVVASELRGNGSSSVRASWGVNYNYHTLIEYDYQAVVDYARSVKPDNAIYILGHSLGGQLGLIYSAINSDKVDGVITVAAGSAYYKSFDSSKQILVRLAAPLFRLAANIMGYFPGKKLGFANREARGMIKDMARQAVTGDYQSVGAPHDYERLLSQFSKPVLTVSISKDKIAQKYTVIHLASKLLKSKMEYWEVESKTVNLSGNRVVPIDHFNWVRDPGVVTKKITDWIQVSQDSSIDAKKRVVGRKSEVPSGMVA